MLKLGICTHLSHTSPVHKSPLCRSSLQTWTTDSVRNASPEITAGQSSLLMWSDALICGSDVPSLWHRKHHSNLYLYSRIWQSFTGTLTNNHKNKQQTWAQFITVNSYNNSFKWQAPVYLGEMVCYWRFKLLVCWLYRLKVILQELRADFPWLRFCGSTTSTLTVPTHWKCRNLGREREEREGEQSEHEDKLID